MPITRMVSGDVPEVRTLLASVETELIADYGTIAWARNNTARTTYLNQRVNGSEFFPVIFRDAGGVLRGAAWGVKVGNDWAIELVAIDKTLADDVRPLRFLDLMKDLAARVPPHVVMFGTMRLGGRLDLFLLDLFLTGKLLNRVVMPSGDRVRYEATAQQVMAI